MNGWKVYLGGYGPPESREKHARVVREADMAASGAPVASEAGLQIDPGAITVAAVLPAFWSHAKTKYPYDASYDGRPRPGEIGKYQDVMRVALSLYATTPGLDIGPNALRLGQEEMTARGWCRNVIDRQTSRIAHMFRWPCRCR